MNREIKFRAKSLKNGEWVYGDYVCENTRHGPICQIYDGESYVLVADATLGQYTGLKDKNGVEIYEGDILLEFAECITVVVFNEEKGAFAKTKNTFIGENLPVYADTQVIGNIYENPELLE